MLRVAPLALELEMSNHRTCAAQDRIFDTDNFVRCPLCQRWFCRTDPTTVAEHRGPLPHPVQNPRTAWADEDDEGGLTPYKYTKFAYQSDSQMLGKVVLSRTRDMVSAVLGTVYVPLLLHARYGICHCGRGILA